MKKNYITLVDRTWKGKEWWADTKRGIRKLTDEEASSLENIREYISPLKPLGENVVGQEPHMGKMYCLKCQSKKGFYVYKNRRGEQVGWYNIYKCADCGAREKSVLR